MANTITAEEFKNNFTRDFPYLPIWESGKAYFVGDIVFSSPNFYKSKINANLQPLTDLTAWELTQGNINSYLTDTDITKAISEALLNFADSIFGDTDFKIPLLYLTAYYLVLDIKNSTAGLNSSAYTSFISSKSVGSVSESYSLPSWASNNPMFSLYLNNGYGQKYLTYLIPRLRSGTIGLFSYGATTID